MNKVSIRHGSEGPRHDPYAFEEISVERPQGTVMLHSGLGTWLNLNGKLLTTHDALAEVLFERLVGVSPQVLQIAIQRNRARVIARHLNQCPAAKGAHSAPGYPGESFNICGCGHVLEYSFDRSAIE